MPRTSPTPELEELDRLLARLRQLSLIRLDAVVEGVADDDREALTGALANLAERMEGLAAKLNADGLPA